MRKGFTLIELMIVIAVITILASLVLVGLSGAQKAGRDTKRQETMTLLQTGLERYYADHLKYPVTVTDVGGFAGLIALLWTDGYLNGNCPIEPAGGIYITSDGSPCAVGMAVTGTNITKGGSWGTLTSWPVGYIYSSDGSTYTLTLQKESGGPDVTFKNP